MSVRRIIISDMHFGSGDDLLRAPLALDRIEPELAWADELVINGDLFELVFASLAEAVAAARPFLSLVDRHVKRVHFIPGNHDHHFVSLAGDERRFAQILGQPEPPPFRVMPAERLLRSLCPNVDVVTAYPICELDGLRITHGHYIAPHIEAFGWRMMDRLAWAMTGEQQRQERLTVTEYEALMAPLYEMMYAIANLPQGRRAQQQFERWLVAIANVARAPAKASHQAVAVLHAVLHAVLRRNRSGQLLQPLQAPTAQVLAAMTAVCGNLAVAPGDVIFAHTHIPLDGQRSGDDSYRFFNSGSWTWDRRLRNSPDYRQTAWPGTVLRADGSQPELRFLLADLTDQDLRGMLGDVPQPRRRRAASARRLLRFAS